MSRDYKSVCCSGRGDTCAADEAPKPEYPEPPVFRGANGAEAFGARAVAAEVTPAELREHLTFPSEWGPSEWGPIPFLPPPDILLRRMENQWGNLDSYRGLATTAKGAKSLHV